MVIVVLGFGVCSDVGGARNTSWTQTYQNIEGQKRASEQKQMLVIQDLEPDLGRL